MTDPTSNALRAAEANERPWQCDHSFVFAVSGLTLFPIADFFGNKANASLTLAAVNERDTLLSDLASARSRIAELDKALSGALRLFETIQTQDMTLSIVGKLNHMIVRLRALSKGEG